MSAEERTSRVYFELSETDKKDGAKLTTSRATYERGEEDKAEVGLSLYSIGTERIGDITVDALIAKVVDAGNSQISKYSKLCLSVYDSKDRWVKDYEYKVSEVSTAKVADIAVNDGYKVVISFLVDNNHAGFEVGKGGADGVDDRNQPIVTVVKQTKPGSSVYEHATLKFVVDNGDNVAKYVSEDKYDGTFPFWFEDYYDSKEDKDYVLVYEGDLTKVTKDIEIKANWVEDKEGLNRFSKVEAEKEYDELDANKDGVVSCEEALGKGWVWNNETSACELKGSSNTGSYVPNTATK